MKNSINVYILITIGEIFCQYNLTLIDKISANVAKKLVKKKNLQSGKSVFVTSVGEEPSVSDFCDALCLQQL